MLRRKISIYLAGGGIVFTLATLFTLRGWSQMPWREPQPVPAKLADLGSRPIQDKQVILTDYRVMDQIFEVHDHRPGYRYYFALMPLSASEGSSGSPPVMVIAQSDAVKDMAQARAFIANPVSQGLLMRAAHYPDSVSDSFARAYPGADMSQRWYFQPGGTVNTRIGFCGIILMGLTMTALGFMLRPPDPA